MEAKFKMLANRNRALGFGLTKGGLKEKLL